MTQSLATITVELVDGTQVVVPDSLEQITPYVLQEQRDWFEDEIKFLRRLVQPGQTVVDIGANVGVYALSLARKVGPSGQVWAFEPASATAALLAGSIAANGTSWLHLQQQALSDRAGTAWLQTPGHSELNSLSADQQGRGEQVRLTTLDACLDTFGWQQVDLLKIDAEGEEARILAGGLRFFAELSPLVMFEVKAGAELHLELVERFRALGYESFRLVPGLDALMPFDPAAGVDGYLLNLFVAKVDRIKVLEASGRLVRFPDPQPPEPALLEAYHWRQLLTPLPYALALARRWEQHESSETAVVTEPLALWGFARDPAQPIAQRLAALQRSYRLLSEQAISNDQLIRLSTLIRVASDLGERGEAVRALGHLIPALEAGIEPDPKEPFLPPSPRFDGIDPEDRLGEWLDAAALEGDEQLGHYSSYFSGTKARPRLERMQTLGFAGEAIQQRLSLLNRRFPPRTPASPAMECPNSNQIACSKLAWELIQAGDHKQGKLHLARAREMRDTCSLSLYFIGRALFCLGERLASVNYLQRAIELDPSNPTLLLELGIALKGIGEPASAEALLHQALLGYVFKLRDRDATPGDLYNVGLAYTELGDTAQGLEFFNQALALDPGMENALFYKATILMDLPDRQDEALERWQQLLEINPSNQDALRAHAKLLIDFGDVQEAIDLLDNMLKHDRNNTSTHHLLAFAHSICGVEATKQHLDHLNGYWINLHNISGRGAEFQAPLALPGSGSKLRIGFLSAEIGDHVVNLFLDPFLTHYDRGQFEVELIESHEYRSNLAAHSSCLADAVVTVQGLGPNEARQRIRSRGYHVIVETSGFTANSGIEILAQRCAIVQCHYIGFHASTGLDTIDWFIGDELTADEELANQYVERLWRLPRVWLARRREPTLPDALSLQTGKRPILGSFNQFGKVRQETLRYWAAAMHRVPESKLVLKSSTSTSRVPQERIIEELEHHGIDSQRVTFLPRAASYWEHLECYRSIDVALDTTPWAGATTTFDALMMGVPVVGILGGATAGRMTCSILQALGKGRWITTTPDAFAETVEHLANDLTGLRSSRSALRQEVIESVLFDGEDLTRHLENAFRAMVHCKVR